MTVIHELLDELMSACEMIGYATSGNERASHRATRDKAKAELLSILDAEGDGGEAGEVDDDTVKRAWLAFDGQFFEDRLSPLSMERMRRTISTALPHPARSGVVSDEYFLTVMELIEASRGYAGPLDDPDIGWRGTLPSHPDLFKCEKCGQEHLDCAQIPHTPYCRATRFLKAIVSSERML